MEHQSGLAGAPALEERPRAGSSVDELRSRHRNLAADALTALVIAASRIVCPVPPLARRIERKEASAGSKAVVEVG